MNDTLGSARFKTYWLLAFAALISFALTVSANSVLWTPIEALIQKYASATKFKWVLKGFTEELFRAGFLAIFVTFFCGKTIRSSGFIFAAIWMSLLFISVEKFQAFNVLFSGMNNAVSIVLVSFSIFSQFLFHFFSSFIGAISFYNKEYFNVFLVATCHALFNILMILTPISYTLNYTLYKNLPVKFLCIFVLGYWFLILRERFQ